MSKFLAGIAALALMGAAALPIQARAAERDAGLSTASNQQATEFSSHRRYYRHRHRYGYRYWGPRRYWGPGYRYGYYGPRYAYPYYGYPYRYGYYRPGISLGIGPFGFGFF